MNPEGDPRTEYARPAKKTANTKPTAPTPAQDRIPAALRAQDRWVLWRYEWMTDKWTKVPYRADGRGKASTKHPATWATFNTAWKAYETRRQRADGIGFVIGAGIVGVDIDHCRDPETGELTPEAAEAIRVLNTYTEVSPSGAGIRAFAFGELPGTRKKAGAFEMYDGDGGRYLTVTGQHLTHTPNEPQPRQTELAVIHAQHIEPPTAHVPAPVAVSARDITASANTGMHLTDRDVLARMRRAKPAAASLYDGDMSAYDGDHSRADLALCSHLAWWCDYDAEQVDRLFRQSALMRDKWDEQRGAETYGAMTIREAIGPKRPGDRYTGVTPTNITPLGRDPTDPGPNEDDAIGEATLEGERIHVRNDRPSRPIIPVGRIAPQTDPALAEYRDTDAGNAERFVHYTRGAARYAPGIGWLLWTGTHWEPDPSELVLRLMLDTMRATEATAALDDDPERRTKLRKHAHASEALGRMRAALELARTDPAVHVLADLLDADPWTLNVMNGLLDLRTGTLRPHNPAALCTKLAPAAFDLDAEHPALHALLDVLEQDGRAEFIRSIAGQALTGRSAKAVYVLHGVSGTAKSTTAEMMAAMLGPYAVNVEPSTLITSKHGNSAGTARADLVALRGARLAIAGELPAGGRLESQLIKRLTGGDRITARSPYARETITFAPGHTLVLHTNNELRADWSDDGMRSRLHVVPFTVKPAKDNKKIRTALLEDPTARAAVLAWATVGAVTWYRNDEQITPPPQAVEEHTRAYWIDQDPFALWAEDALDFTAGPETFTPTADLARKYQEWCDANGERPLSAKALGRWLASKTKTHGIEATKWGKAGTRGWKGIRLRGPTG